MSVWDDEMIDRANRRNAGQFETKTTNDYKLSRKELEKLVGTRIEVGTYYARCPCCGWDKERSNESLEITSTLTTAEWQCDYCGIKGRCDGTSDKEDERDDREQRELKRMGALRIWEECEPIRSDDLAVVYLRARGLELPPNHDAVLRWHERCPFGPNQRLPCMVAPLRHMLSDHITGIHRTHIVSARSGEADRKAYGELMGSAVKLWSLGSSEELAIGEGIETVLAAVKLGHAHPPAWAATVAGNLGRLPVIGQVRRLTILSDNDASTTGQVAATKLYHTHNRAGVDAVIKRPRTAKDFNDLLKEGRP